MRSESKVSTTSSAAVKLQAAFEGGQAGGFSSTVLTFVSYAPGLVERNETHPIHAQLLVSAADGVLLVPTFVCVKFL